MLVAVGGVASAATGKPFVLGESNVASKTTTLQSTGSGATLKLKPAAGQPALAVANKILIRRLNASLLRGKAPRDFAPANGSKRYAPAAGSPNYAPASGSPNYAPSSGSPNYLSSSAPQLIYSGVVSSSVDGGTTESNLVNVSLASPGTGTLTMVFVGACSASTAAWRESRSSSSRRRSRSSRSATRSRRRCSRAAASPRPIRATCGGSSPARPSGSSPRRSGGSTRPRTTLCATPGRRCASPWCASR